MQTSNAHVYAYKETKIKTASQGQIIVMLYDASIRNMDKAIDLIAQGPQHYDEVNAALLKARDIVTELICSLDMENGGEFAQRIFGLYMWFNEQLMEGNLKKSTEPIKVVRSMMNDLREAWAKIAVNSTVEGRAAGGLNLAT